MCDDQRHDCMSCADHPFIATPNMDRLAEEGIQFTNGFTGIPLCAPSRATHLTGLYPHQHGVVHNRAQLKTEVDTWPELLQKAGYRTGFFGKIHYSTTTQPSGMPQAGFDRWVSFQGQGEYNDPTLIIDGKSIRHQGYNTDLLADYANKFIMNEDERPWAICVWFKAPHGPFTPPSRYADSYADIELDLPKAFNASTIGKPLSLRTRKPMGHEHGWYPDGTFIRDKYWDQFMRDYVRTIQGVDDAMGSLLNTLDQNGLTENTMVIHTSDHGYFHGEFGLADKRWMYDPSIRIPYLIRYPNLVQSVGKSVDDLVLSLDIPATIMDFCGLGVPNNYQGYSLRPLLVKDGKWNRQNVFIEYFEDPPFPDLPSMLCLRTQTRKLIRYLRSGEGDEFYDLDQDPEERHNVINEPNYAEQVEDLQRQLDSAKSCYNFTKPESIRRM